MTRVRSRCGGREGKRAAGVEYALRDRRGNRRDADAVVFWARATALRGAGWHAADRARAATVLAERHFSGTAYDGGGGHPEGACRDRRDDAGRRRCAYGRGEYGVRRLEASRHGARPLRRYRRAERARRVLQRRSLRDVPLDAGY